MSGRIWKTKKDIQKDIAKMTGRRFQNIDNCCLIVGQKPPPAWTCQDDLDELNLHFGDVSCNISNEVDKPDLMAIQEAIRLVNDYSSVNDEVNMCSTDQCSFDITISKLNPTVQEFVPKNCESSVSESIKDEANCDRTLNNKNDAQYNIVSDSFTNSGELKNDVPETIVLESYLSVTKAKISDNNTKVSPTEVIIDQNKDEIRETNGTGETENKVLHKGASAILSKDEVICTEIAAKELKKTIMMNNSKNPQMKRAKNVAIANLQKLLSIPNENPCNNKVKKEIKLITPDYYEKSIPTNNKKSTAEVPEQSLTTTSEVLTNGTNNDNDLTNNMNKFQSLQTFTIEVTKPTKEICSEPSGSPQKQLEKPHSLPEIQNETEPAIDNIYNLSDPQIQNSINKVSTWLNKKQAKPRNPDIFFNPVTFRRKEVKTTSPVPTHTVTETKVKSSSHVTEFKPSKYAEELTKMYTARAQEKKKNIYENTWVNLDLILKEKDEQIRKSKESVDKNTEKVELDLEI